MKTEYQYIHFEQNENKSWSCINSKYGDRLALIDFYKPWRQWCVIEFEPDCVFSGDCLDDISDFLKQLNKEIKN